MRKFLVTDIEWDTYGYPVDLPKQMVIESDDEDLLDDDDITEMLMNEITNKTGYCHFGFTYEEIVN